MRNNPESRPTCPVPSSPISSPTRPAGFAAILLALIIGSPLFAVDAGSVSLEDNGGSFVLVNETLRVVIDKTTAEVRELDAFGKPLLTRDCIGYYFANTMANGAKFDSSLKKGIGRIVRQDRDHVEVACSFEELESAMGFSTEIHFALRAGISGLYLYTVDSGRGPVASTPTVSIGQLRYAFRVNPALFPRFQVDDTRRGVMPRPRQQKKIMDATYVFDGDGVYTKYDWAAEQKDDFVYGVLGQNLGFWLVKPSSEYAGGGPLKQDITVHFTDQGPILLWHPLTSHYGTLPFVPDRPWRRVCGPVLWYANQSGDDDALWTDANKRSAMERASWPYPWVPEPAYAATQRTRVSGKATLGGRPSLSNGWAILASRDGDWQVQNGGTHFYAPILADGRFEIPHVIPGRHWLTLIADGIIGEFRTNALDIPPGKTFDLAPMEWNPRRFGNTLWQIGVPNRKGTEFRRGNPFHYWGVFLHYPTDFPNGVNWVAGAGDPARDWGFVHPAVPTLGEAAYWSGGFAFSDTDQRMHLEASEGKPTLDKPFQGNLLAPWTVRFPKVDGKTGTATLTIAIAGTRAGSLNLQLNGAPLARFDRFPYPSDSSVPRSGSHGLYQILYIPFDAGRLSGGENLLTLSHVRPTHRADGKRENVDLFASTIYDCLRFEVDEKSPWKPTPPFTFPEKGSTEIRVGGD